MHLIWLARRRRLDVYYDATSGIGNGATRHDLRASIVHGARIALLSLPPTVAPPPPSLVSPVAKLMSTVARARAPPAGSLPSRVRNTAAGAVSLAARDEHSLTPTEHISWRTNVQRYD